MNGCLETKAVYYNTILVENDFLIITSRLFDCQYLDIVLQTTASFMY